MYSKKFKVQTDSGVIQCSTYTLRASTQLNLAKNAKNVELMKATYSEILNDHAVADLPKHDAELVLINLIAKSEHEEDVKIPYVCECGHMHEVTLKPENMYIDYGESDIEKLYPFDKFKVKFTWPALWADDNVTEMIVKSMRTIYAKDEQIDLEDLSEDELNDLYDAITEDDIKKIKKLLTSPKPVAVFSLKCPQCEKRSVETIKGFKSFVELL